MIMVQDAIDLADLRGFFAEVRGDRLHVEKNGKTFSTIITDGMVSRVQFWNFITEAV